MFKPTLNNSFSFYFIVLLFEAAPGEKAEVSHELNWFKYDTVSLNI